MNQEDVKLILSNIAELKKQIQDNIEELILTEAVAINREYPEVLKMGWTQYTPSFNDGEPCEFTMCNIGFIGKKEIDEARENEGDEDLEIHGYMWEEYNMCYRSDDHISPELKDRLNDFASNLHELEEYLGAAFGTWGAEVTIDMVKGTLSVEEYDCGY